MRDSNPTSDYHSELSRDCSDTTVFLYVQKAINRMLQLWTAPTAALLRRPQQAKKKLEQYLVPPNLYMHPLSKPIFPHKIISKALPGCRSIFVSKTRQNFHTNEIMNNWQQWTEIIAKTHLYSKSWLLVEIEISGTNPANPPIIREYNRRRSVAAYIFSAIIRPI